MGKLMLEANQITVSQLIEKLKSMPQDAPLFLEGEKYHRHPFADENAVGGVELQENGSVLITMNY